MSLLDDLTPDNTLLPGQSRHPNTTVDLARHAALERARALAEARTHALAAAVRYVSSGRSLGQPVLDYAETFEAWLLRPEPDA